jgi:IPT/TIG domain-containing protein
MLPEDRLDALLSFRVENRQGQTLPPFVGVPDERDGLQPLLDAADRVAELGKAEPSQDFVAQLESLFLARAAYLRERDGIATMPHASDLTPLPIVETPPMLGNDEPTLPRIEWAAARDDTTAANTTPRWRRYPLAQRHTVWRRLLWPAIAAALLLAIGLTTFTAAAAANPGSPLYGLRLWEQNIKVGLASSAADRTNLHLGYAQDALSALRDATARRDLGSTFDDALATFRGETRAAATNLDSVPAGGERDKLSAQLDRLRAQGREVLRAALAILPWPERPSTTDALAEIGDNVLSATWASMVYSENGQGQHLWRITVTGLGFQKDAVLLVNGQPAGTVISVTPTTLVAQLPGDDSAPLPDSIGVANPDNTAAVTTNIVSRGHENDSTPGAQQTPGSDDHGGSGSGGSGSSTPDASPSPTSTLSSSH